MVEYISREEAIKELREVYEYEYPTASGDFDEYASHYVPNVLKNIPAANVQTVVNTENMALVSDKFICKRCGIYLKDYIKVVMDEGNDGYFDEQHYKYEPKFCPECGAKVRKSY